METVIDAITSKLFSFICHQDINILISLEGSTLMICPRCAGLHLGFITALIAFIGRSVSLHPKAVFLLAVLTAVPAIHWLLGYSGILNPNSLARFGTGLVGGLAFATVVATWRMSNLSKSEKFRNLKLGAVIGIIVMPLILITAGTWATVSLILLLAVSLNLLFLTDTLLRFVRVRLIKPSRKREQQW